MKTTTEPPIEKFTVNGLEFIQTLSEHSEVWTAVPETGDHFCLTKHGGSWVWKCHNTDWEAVNVPADQTGQPAEVIAAIALADATRYFRTLAGNLTQEWYETECLQRELDLKTHVLDQYEKEALITLAELEKVTRDAAELLEALKETRIHANNYLDQVNSQITAQGPHPYESFIRQKERTIATIRKADAAIAKAEGREP